MDDLNKSIEKEVITTQTETFTPAQLKEQYDLINLQKQNFISQIDERINSIIEKYNSLKEPPYNLNLPPIDSVINS